MEQNLPAKQPLMPKAQQPSTSQIQQPSTPQIQQSFPPQVQQETYDKIHHSTKKAKPRLTVSASLNIILISILVVQLLLAPISVPFSEDDDDSEEKYDDLSAEYVVLETKFTNLQYDYYALEFNYTTLAGGYEKLQYDYNNLQEDYNLSVNSSSEWSNRYFDLQDNHTMLEANYSQLDRDFGQLQVSYARLELDYENLQDNYSQLKQDYENLQGNYSQLYEMYWDNLNLTWELYDELFFIENINLGHLMESCYGDIRDIYDERWDGFWWDLIGDDDEVIEFAANLAEHDLGRIFWTDPNERYKGITGENMNQVAHSKLSYVPDYLEIDEYGDPVIKVESILDFVTTWVHYEHDLNGEFLSPIETLTFRSGDCDDYSILVSALFELVGLESGIVFVTNDEGDGHAMVLLHLDDLGSYSYYYFSDLTSYGLQEGKWIIIEPQVTIERQHDEDWMEQWNGEYFIEIDVHV